MEIIEVVFLSFVPVCGCLMLAILIAFLTTPKVIISPPAVSQEKDKNTINLNTWYDVR